PVLHDHAAGRHQCTQAARPRHARRRHRRADAGGELMDLDLNPNELKFRDELRAWLAANVPPPWTGPTTGENRKDYIEYLRKWQRTLFEGGWAGISWPKPFGGRGASLMEQAIFQEELALADAPQLLGTIGLSLVGPTIIALGTDEQKARYLSKILS